MPLTNPEEYIGDNSLSEKDAENRKFFGKRKLPRVNSIPSRIEKKNRWLEFAFILMILITGIVEAIRTLPLIWHFGLIILMIAFIVKQMRGKEKVGISDKRKTNL